MTCPTPDSAPSERTRIRRGHKRGTYDRTAIDAILDAGMICHIGHLVDGVPMVLPTAYWREGERVYWHGSAASRMLLAADGAEVCLTVTLLDGMVLARSAFHHSVNYRSVVLLGTATTVTDPAAKLAHLKTLIELWYPSRWDLLRPITDQELKATAVLSMPIDEASAKVRDGGPVDDEEDYALPIWAGVVPVHQKAGRIEADPRNIPGVTPPDHAAHFDPGDPLWLSASHGKRLVNGPE
jgi:hypothetical protein